MIDPVASDAALVAHIRATAGLMDEHVRLWWLGQSGFLVQWRGRHLLLDPYLSDSLTKKYANTEKPHVRMTRRVVDPAQLDFIDVVTSSHAHTDHLDAETLKPLLRANRATAVVIAEANRGVTVERLPAGAAAPIGLTVGEHVELAGFRIEAVPAAHETLDPRFVGYVIHCDDWTLYHSGDTVLYDGMEERLRAFAIDVALLPINGRAPERQVAGNLDAEEAAALGKAVGAGVVIPCHYEMFTFNTADPRDFVAACDRVGQAYQVMRCGERWDTSALSARRTSRSTP